MNFISDCALTNFLWMYCISGWRNEVHFIGKVI